MAALYAYRRNTTTPRYDSGKLQDLPDLLIIVGAECRVETPAHYYTDRRAEHTKKKKELTSMVSRAGWLLIMRRSALSCTDLIASSFSSSSLIRSCVEDIKLSISGIQRWKSASRSILSHNLISCLTALSMKLITRATIHKSLN